MKAEGEERSKGREGKWEREWEMERERAGEGRGGDDWVTVEEVNAWKSPNRVPPCERTFGSSSKPAAKAEVRSDKKKAAAPDRAELLDLIQDAINNFRPLDCRWKKSPRSSSRTDETFAS